MTKEQMIRDAMGLVGTSLLGYGAWLHYPPLGFIAGGALLVMLTVVGTIRGRL